MINEHKKGVKAVKYTKKAKGIEPMKPRNFVAKNAVNTGAGAHTDKKKAAKQGITKHKKSYAEALEAELKQLSELKDTTKASYKEKAQAQVKELEPHAKNGEYKDIAQRAIDRRKKGLAKVKESWTHDTLAAELFETPSYETRLQEMLEGAVAFMEGGTDDGVTMFSKSPGSHQHLNDASDDHKSREKDLEGDTVKNSLHTIVRVATHLEKAVTDDEEFPEWVSEKIGAIKSMMVSVMDYVISSHEQQDGDRLDHGPK